MSLYGTLPLNAWAESLGTSNWVTVTASDAEWTYADPLARLSEAEAWREIARRIEERGCEEGLCVEIATIQAEERIWSSTSLRMIERVQLHLRAARRWWDRKAPALLDESGVAGPRILAAYLLALEAEEEAP